MTNVAALPQEHIYDSRFPLVVRDGKLVPHVNPGDQVKCLCHGVLQTPIAKIDVVMTPEQSEEAWQFVAKLGREQGLSACDHCREFFPDRIQFREHTCKGVK